MLWAFCWPPRPCQTADARPLILKMLRGITAPLGLVMGVGRQSSRRAAYHHRAVASRPGRQPSRQHRRGRCCDRRHRGHDRSLLLPHRRSQRASCSQHRVGAKPDTKAQDAQAAAVAPFPNPPQRNAALGIWTTGADVQRAHPHARLAQARLGTVGPLAYDRL